MSRTGRADAAAAAAMMSGVSSVESSTKITSSVWSPALASSLRSSSATFGPSLKVGMMTEISRTVLRMSAVAVWR